MKCIDCKYCESAIIENDVLKIECRKRERELMFLADKNHSINMNKNFCEYYEEGKNEVCKL